MCPQEHLSHISNTLGLSFELKRIGPLAALVAALVYLLALFLSAVSNTTENLSASFYSELLIQITCQHLLLLVGFDTLIYRKYYDTPPILVGHQDYFLAPLPGSEALLVRKLVRKLLAVITVMESNPFGSLFGGSTITATVVDDPSSAEIVPFKIPTKIAGRIMDNRYDGTVHPGNHLLYIHELCGLFKCAGISMDIIKRKLFTLSLDGRAAEWYSLLKNGPSLSWSEIVPLFYYKFYPPSEIHKDRNSICTFWPYEGESIAQAWGRLKLLMLKCPVHGIPNNIVINNFYARLSYHDKDLLDTSCAWAFTRMKDEDKWDLLDRIQENTEGWENDKGRESGINYDFECIKSFMETDSFRHFNATYGLDSQVAVSYFKAFASYLEIPKQGWEKFHEPYKDNADFALAKTVEVNTVDHILPEPYVERVPFPVKVKEHSILASVVSKSERKPKVPDEQISVEHEIAMVKELVTENVEGGHIVFCEEASNLVTHPEKAGRSSVPLLSVKIGEHCYYGLCDIGASTSAISHALYMEIRKEIEPCELEEIDVVIQLANRETICPIGIVRDVEVLCGRTKYPADFLVLATAISDTCPIIFGRPFLNTCSAVVDCQKEKVFTNFDGESYEFNFSKFAKNYYEPELPNENFQVEQLASIAVAPNNALQQFLEDHESDVFEEERKEIDDVFLRQPQMLRHDLPVEDLGISPPPKEDPVFDLKPLPDDLKYVYIDDKKIYPVIISSKLSGEEETKLLHILKKHRGALGYTLDDLKGISPAICQHAINIEPDAKPVVEAQRRLIPKMKEVVRNEVLKLLEAGIIYPIADSRWVSPVHCVPKKGGITVVPNENDELIPQRVVVGYRMCIDFRKVNKVTKKDHYPLPFIDQMLERLSKKTHFCFLDGYSGFSQIAVRKEDQEKTTFTCPYGTYAYRRMPFGLCNAPATF